tara:strand:- start:16524 stop:17183 length:660 start_codon:yes stop_codon:yes gene_type:complete
MKRSAPLKRTPMKRSQPLRRTTGEARTSAKVKKCAVRECRQPFIPRSMTHKACGPDCAQALGKAEAEKKAKRAALEDRKQTRAELEALKTIPQLKKEAQREFNRFIRARDRRAGFSCICCDRPFEWERIGGAVDAGHYRSTGSADHLRFDEDNCHAQRSDCNRFGAGRAVDYRIGLIRRIGSARVEALEARNETAKWTREGLRQIRDTYRARARGLEKS